MSSTVGSSRKMAQRIEMGMLSMFLLSMAVGTQLVSRICKICLVNDSKASKVQGVLILKSHFNGGVIIKSAKAGVLSRGWPDTVISGARQTNNSGAKLDSKPRKHALFASREVYARCRRSSDFIGFQLGR